MLVLCRKTLGRDYLHVRRNDVRQASQVDQRQRLVFVRTETFYSEHSGAWEPPPRGLGTRLERLPRPLPAFRCVSHGCVRSFIARSARIAMVSHQPPEVAASLRYSALQGRSLRVSAVQKEWLGDARTLQRGGIIAPQWGLHAGSLCLPVAAIAVAHTERLCRSCESSARAKEAFHRGGRRCGH